MLQKLLEIDHKRSDLNKKKIKPVVFKIRSHSQTRGGNHPQVKLNLKSRMDELKLISEENQIILQKLKEVKPLINHKQLERESKQLHNLS